MAKAIKCFVCKHPKRKEIDAALKAGVSQTEIVKTLCPEIKKHSVQRHYAQDHHLTKVPADWTPASTVASRGAKLSKKSKGAIVSKESKTARGRGRDMVTVHMELPWALVKRLKHKAVDAEVPMVVLVRELLERGV
jgi:hypothetical protein